MRTKIMMMMEKDLGLRSETNTAPSPEQEKESVNLQHNTNNGPPDQDHTHAPQEETGGLHLVFLEKEAKRPLQPDDKGQSSHKQYLHGREDNELLKKPGRVQARAATRDDAPLIRDRRRSSLERWTIRCRNISEDGLSSGFRAKNLSRFCHGSDPTAARGPLPVIP